MVLSRMSGASGCRARLFAAALCAVVVALSGAGLQAEVPGTATLSGTVTASQEFTAAQVYARNLDRDMVYQVYTSGGRYRAVALFPGTYEVSASTKHLESDVQTVTVSAGDAAEVDLTLGPLSGDAPPLVIPAGRTAMESGRSGTFEYASYDEIYPPGPGKAVAEQVCMACHGENFFPTRPGTQRQWETWIDHMVGSTLGEQDPTRYAQGLLSFRASTFRFGRQDRDDLLAYVVENFGPDSKRRRVAIEQQTPVDEEALGKAMYIEYYLAKDGPGEGVNDEPWARDRVGRYGQDPRFDADGNVWLVDRGVPHRLVKLDPRTGEQWEYLYPDPRNGNHEILIDPSGLIWLPEHRGRTGAKEKRLLGFNPETETFEYQIPMDPDDVVRNPTKFMQSLAMDSKGNIYVGWIMGGALSKWDRATGEVSVFRIPTPHAIPYGVVADRDDNIWIALWSGGKIVKFDTSNNSWTEFTAPYLPGAHAAAERRLAEQHLVGHLLGRQAGRQAGQARPVDGQDVRVHDPAAERRALRRRRRPLGQHLGPRRRPADRRRARCDALEVRPADGGVHVLSEAAAARRLAQDSDHAGRGRLVLAAGQPRGAGVRGALSRHGRHRRPGGVLHVRASGVPVPGAGFRADRRGAVTWKGR